MAEGASRVIFPSSRAENAHGETAARLTSRFLHLDGEALHAALGCVSKLSSDGCTIDEGDRGGEEGDVREEHCLKRV